MSFLVFIIIFHFPLYVLLLLKFPIIHHNMDQTNLLFTRNVKLKDKQYNISDILVHIYMLLITLNYVVLKETSISFP